MEEKEIARLRKCERVLQELESYWYSEMSNKDNDIVHRLCMQGCLEKYRQTIIKVNESEVKVDGTRIRV